MQGGTELAVLQRELSCVFHGTGLPGPLVSGDMFVGIPDLELGNGGSDLHINVKIGAQVDLWGRHWLVNISSGAC
jgi:hypothetical protein